jgi:hypothetical protein
MLSSSPLFYIFMIIEIEQRELNGLSEFAKDSLAKHLVTKYVKVAMANGLSLDEMKEELSLK